MTTPSDTPPVLPPPKFKLPTYALILWFPAAAVLAWFSYQNNAGDFSFRLGAAMGGMISSLLFSMFFSWAAWRLSGREGKGHGLVFLAVLALLIAGQVFQSLKRVRDARAATNAKLEQVAKDNEKEMRTTLDRGESVTAAQSEKIVQHTQDELQKMVDGTSGEDQRLGRAMQAFVGHLQEVQKNYLAAATALHTETFFEPERAATAAERAELLAAVQTFKTRAGELRQAIDEAEASLGEEMKKQQVSPKGIRDAVAGYRSSTRARLPLLGRIRDKDEALADIMAEYLQFIEKYEGQWKRNPETKALILPDDASVEEYNRLTTAARQVYADQVELQRQILTKH